jgi:purine-cytosine permease-like protein
MNIYNYLFYILYKCVKLTTKQDLQPLVAQSTTNVLLFGITNYYLAILIFVNPFQYISYNILLLIIIFVTPLISLYFFNKRFFLRNEKYKEIESLYDNQNKLKKVQFILITALYMSGSIGMMIWAGINYANNG